MTLLLKRYFQTIDWGLLGTSLALVGAGLVTMHSFVGEDIFFTRQQVWLVVGLVLFFLCSLVDWRFLRRTGVVVTLFALSGVALALLFLLGTQTLGAISRFDFGLFFIQPADPAKIVLIIVLAKYFSRRHVAIGDWRHVLVSGVYAGLFFILLFLQPDFGAAVIVFLIWLGMVLVSGISKKHLVLVGLAGILSFLVLWFFIFAPYQKARIMTFLNPLTDLQGAGYNAYQSTIAVGAGQLVGKGVGYGTQSRLEFLPEYETDFIVAAFAEEWGFLGMVILFVLFGIVLWRIVAEARRGESNFETLFILGVAIMLFAHFIIHVGMNIGLLPVTGTIMPFMSYGGSHLVTEFIALGMVMGMRRYHRTIRRETLAREFVGPQ